MKNVTADGMHATNDASRSFDASNHQKCILNKLTDKGKENDLYRNLQNLTERYLVKFFDIPVDHYYHSILKDTIVDQVFQKVKSQGDKFKGYSSLVFKVTHNKVIDFRRSRNYKLIRKEDILYDYATEQNSEFYPNFYYADSLSQEINDETLSELECAVSELIPMDRMIIQQIFYEGIKENVVAKNLNMKDYALSKRKKQILAKLAQTLKN
jgi:RNA polymerase sigma factor (sigma-70 family)